MGRNRGGGEGNHQSAAERGVEWSSIHGNTRQYSIVLYNVVSYCIVSRLYRSMLCFGVCCVVLNCSVMCDVM